MKRIEQLADLILKTREVKQRLETKKEFITYDLKKLPEEIAEMFQTACRLAHQDELPNDWIYNQIDNALIAISESTNEEYLQESAQNNVDIYNYDLINWLSEHLNRIESVNETVQEYGIDSKNFDLIQVISMTQARFIETIYFTIYQEFNNFLDSDLTFNNFELIEA